MKPASDAAQLAQERAQQMVGTKGRTSQPRTGRTRRTQGRVSVSPAPDGPIWQAPEHAKLLAFGAIAMDYRHGPGLQTRRESDGTTTVVLFGGAGLLLLNETQPVTMDTSSSTISLINCISIPL
jgi:hypothetical protein